MQRLIMGLSILTWGACTSMGGPLMLLTAEQSTALEQDCGLRPISMLKGLGSSFKCNTQRP